MTAAERQRRRRAKRDKDHVTKPAAFRDGKHVTKSLSEAELVECIEKAREEGRREGRAAMLDYRHAELQREYRRVLDRRNGLSLMQPEEYRLILSALHPDSRAAMSEQRLAEAFAAFRKYRLLLVHEATEPTPKPRR